MAAVKERRITGLWAGGRFKFAKMQRQVFGAEAPQGGALRKSGFSLSRVPGTIVIGRNCATHESAATGKGQDEPRAQKSGRMKPDSPDQDKSNRDDGYLGFVERMWAQPTIPVPPTMLVWNHRDLVDQFKLYSVVPMPSGAIYLNGYVNDQRMTLAGDGRHHLEYSGIKIDESAFWAVADGVVPDLAFRPRVRARSAIEACSPEFCYGELPAQTFVIGYANSSGEIGYRVISTLRSVDEEGFTAMCHFRWQTRRSFVYACVIEVIDGETGQIMSVTRLKNIVQG